MLVSLHVKNLALIQETEVFFGPHLNILTGETGAGKSIVIDAMGAVLGGRAGRQTHIVLFPRTRWRAFTQMTRGRGWSVSRGGKAGDTREGMRARVRVARGGCGREGGRCARRNEARVPRRRVAYVLAT